MSDNYVFTPVGPPKFNSEIEELAWPIWNERWWVKMRYQDTLSEEEIKAFDFRTSGDEYIDHCNRVEKVQVCLTIAEIIKHIERKMAVDLLNESDSHPMFMRITAYLRYWKRQLDSNVNAGGAPIPDLILMDKLAASLFVFAAPLMGGEHHQTGFSTLLHGSRATSRASLFNRAKDTEREKQKMPTYDSLEDYFTRRALRG